MFLRRIKTKSGTYLAEVESRREGDKVRQRIVRYIGREMEGEVTRRVYTSDVEVMEVKRHLDVEVIDRLADELELKNLVPKKSLIFVYAQLIDRPSINRMEEWLKETEVLEFLGIAGISTKELYDSLSSLNEIDFTRVEASIAGRLLPHERGTSSIILDVTDTYFEGRKGTGGRPRRGKDGKVKRLLQIALAVTGSNSFPLMHRTYDGNISSLKIFQDMSKDLWRHDYSFIVLDRGMVREGWIHECSVLGFRLICGLAKTPSLVNEFLSGIERDEIFSKSNQVRLKNTAVYFRTFRYRDGRLIVVYNPSLEVMKREHYYETHGKEKDGDAVVDENVARYLGYSLIYHNTGLGDREAIRKYFEKDTVERAFKQLKGVLDLRPVRVWLREHVEAHVKVCYLAYAILSLLDYRVRGLDITGVEALERLRTGYTVHLKDSRSGFEWNKTITLRKIQQDILKSCSVKR